MDSNADGLWVLRVTWLITEEGIERIIGLLRLRRRRLKVFIGFAQQKRQVRVEVLVIVLLPAQGILAMYDEVVVCRLREKLDISIVSWWIGRHIG